METITKPIGPKNNRKNKLNPKHKQPLTPTLIISPTEPNKILIP
jgi:hypothetical protein